MTFFLSFWFFSIFYTSWKEFLVHIFSIYLGFIKTFRVYRFMQSNQIHNQSKQHKQTTKNINPTAPHPRGGHVIEASDDDDEEDDEQSDSSDDEDGKVNGSTEG